MSEGTAARDDAHGEGDVEHATVDRTWDSNEL